MYTPKCVTPGVRELIRDAYVTDVRLPRPSGIGREVIAAVGGRQRPGFKSKQAYQPSSGER